MSVIHSLNDSQLRKLANQNKNSELVRAKREKDKRGIRRKKDPPVRYFCRFKDPKICSIGSNRLFHIMKQRPFTDY